MTIYFHKNSSHKKCGWFRLSYILILYIVSIQLILCSARPNQDNTNYEKSSEKNDGVLKVENELPSADNVEPNYRDNESAESKAEIEKKETTQTQRTTDDIGIDEEKFEDEEDEDDLDEEETTEEHTSKIFSELKTSPLPVTSTGSTEPYVEKNDDVSDEIGDYEEKTTELVKSTVDNNNITTTTETLKSSTTIEDKTTKLNTVNGGSMLKNYSFVLFIAVLLHLSA